MTCPNCHRPEKGVVLVCRACWEKVPGKDRVSFYSIYHANRDNPKAYASKAEKILRELRGMSGLRVLVIDHNDRHAKP